MGKCVVVIGEKERKERKERKDKGEKGEKKRKKRKRERKRKSVGRNERRIYTQEKVEKIKDGAE